MPVCSTPRCSTSSISTFSVPSRTSYEKHELKAFYRADYLICFGIHTKPTQTEVYCIPPDLWPFKAYFKNDPVFPAIFSDDIQIMQIGS